MVLKCYRQAVLSLQETVLALHYMYYATFSHITISTARNAFAVQFPFFRYLFLSAYVETNNTFFNSYLVSHTLYQSNYDPKDSS